tara:strand:- start:47 stop:1822 length:1776 start_codon:yes stop_codon:yes gene_type:complete
MAIQLRKNSVPSPKVKLILIDDASVNQMSDIVGRYPWPRGIYVPIIDYLVSSGVKSIYFDILFSEEENSKTSHNQFVNGLNLVDDVHLVGIITEDESVSKTPPPFLEKSLFDQPLPHQFKLIQFNNIYHPIDDLANAVKTIPISNIRPDLDGKYRHIPMLHNYKKTTLFSMPMSFVLNQSENITFNHRTLQTERYKIPLNERAEVTLNWYPMGIENYSFTGVLASWQSRQVGEEPLVPPDVFKDAIVIIGASAVGLHDLKSTPIHSYLPGPEIQATAISNIINNELLTLSSSTINLSLFMILILITPYFVLKIPSIKRYMLILLIPVLILVATVLLFTYNYYIFQAALPLFGFWFTFIAAIGYNSFSEFLEKQKVKQTFSMYVSPKILKELSQNYKTVQPELGKEKEVTILFSDIRSFTSLTETHPVKIIIQLLNDYFDAMIELIQENDGTVDKIIGDAIMAFWNAPIDTENHALKAVRTAIMMQERLKDLNVMWKEKGLPTLDTGIGINTGSCIIGNIGSKRRVNYTLIGDSVNATARLESLCKNYEDSILISESTFLQIKDQLSCDYIDKVSVKGKQEQIKIYAPRGSI